MFNQTSKSLDYSVENRVIILETEQNSRVKHVKS